MNIDDVRKKKIEAQREYVIDCYRTAISKNKKLFINGDDNATSQYIYENQMVDASNIVDKFNKNRNLRVISISKKTKVGMDGLMIEIAKLMTTHSDDDFILNLDNIRIITGMSNKMWESDLIARSPECFEDKIFHHDQLKNSNLNNLSNGLIIIDEIDTGSGDTHLMNDVLKKANILDIDIMKEKNIRLIVVSATIMKELYDLKQWGIELYDHYKMTIPTTYIGHKDFLDNGIIKEFFPIKTKQDAERWIKEDILDKYKNDYRCHIIREKAGKNSNLIKEVCEKNGIEYRPYNSEHTKEIKDIFQNIFKTELTKHIVLSVKGLFRRANLIANKWKLKIGAVHEYYTKNPIMNVQIQGLPGRLTGFWREEIIDKKHITGPYRTSIKVIKEYEEMFDDPFGKKAYVEFGFKKGDRGVLDPDNWKNLEKIKLENVSDIGIPIKLQLSDEILEKLKEINLKKKKQKEQEYKKCINILESGIKSKKITMIDVNKESTKFETFSFEKYNKIKSIRKCTLDVKAENYRFTGFINAYNIHKPYSQEKEKGYFTLDINYFDHKEDDIDIPKGLAFISFERISIDDNNIEGLDYLNEEEKIQPETELIKEIEKVVEEEPKKTSTKGSKSLSNVI
jgi:hypothetical protein